MRSEWCRSVYQPQRREQSQKKLRRKWQRKNRRRRRNQEENSDPKVVSSQLLLSSRAPVHNRWFFHMYVINFPSFYSAFSVLYFWSVYIFITSFSMSVLFSQRRISVDLVDLVKRFRTSIWQLLAKIGFDTGANEPLKGCQKVGKS